MQAKYQEKVRYFHSITGYPSWSAVQIDYGVIEISVNTYKFSSLTMYVQLLLFLLLILFPWADEILIQDLAALHSISKKNHGFRNKNFRPDFISLSSFYIVA